MIPSVALCKGTRLPTNANGLNDEKDACLGFLDLEGSRTLHVNNSEPEIGCLTCK